MSPTAFAEITASERLTTTSGCLTGADECPAPWCECLWMRGRGHAQLSCELRRRGVGDFELEVVRNGRLYGAYRFEERSDAVMFAARLCRSFENNGWMSPEC